MRSYLPSLPSGVSAAKAYPQVTIIVSLVFDFSSDMRVPGILKPGMLGFVPSC